jgi:hypothetical protein
MLLVLKTFELLFLSRHLSGSAVVAILWIWFMSCRPLSVDFLNYEYMFSTGIPFKTVDIPLLFLYNALDFHDIYVFRFSIYLFFALSVLYFCLANRLAIFPFLFNPYLLSMGAFFGKSLISFSFIFIGLTISSIGFRRMLYLLSLIFHPISALSFILLVTHIPNSMYSESRRLLFRHSVLRNLFRLTLGNCIIFVSLPFVLLLSLRFYAISIPSSPALVPTVALYYIFTLVLSFLFFCCKRRGCLYDFSSCSTLPQNTLLQVSSSAFVLTVVYLILFPLSLFFPDYFSRLFLPSLILFTGFLGSFYYRLHSRNFFLALFIPISLVSLIYFLFFASSAPSF